MNILQVIHGFVPDNMAGSEVYTYNLARELSARHKVTVFYRLNRQDLAEYSVHNRPAPGFSAWAVNHTYLNFRSFKDSYLNGEVERKFLDIMDLCSPDIVHFGHLTTLSLSLVRAAKQRGVPVVFTLHDFWLLCPRGQLLDTAFGLCETVDPTRCSRCLESQFLSAAGNHLRHNFAGENNYRRLPRLPGVGLATGLMHRLALEFLYVTPQQRMHELEARREAVREIFSLTDVFIAPSHFLRDKFIAAGLPPEKIVLSDYGFPTAAFKNFHRWPGSSIRFGYLGSWIPSKGLDVLVKAFISLNHPQAELHLHGAFTAYEGHEGYPNYIRLLARHPRIYLHGQYHTRDIAAILSQIDVLVTPSLWFENSPLVIHEAFLAKTPVIASRLGGMAELVEHGISGLLFTRGDTEQLKRAMLAFLKRPELVKDLGDQAPPVKDIKDNCLELEAIYRREYNNIKSKSKNL